MGRYRGVVKAASSSKILVLVLGIQTALIIARTLNLYYTGFQTPDEANYILDVMIGRPYGYRTFFNGQLGAFFQIFGIDSIARFVVFFPFYLALWTFAFIILAYKTVGLITRNRITRDFVILTLPFAISYSLLSVGLVTETPALTMCMLGIYALIRYSKVEKKWYLVAISGAAFLAAAYTREPYELFPVVVSVVLVGLAVLRKAPPHHAVTFVLISLLIVAPNSQFSGAYAGLSNAPATAQTVTSVTSQLTSSVIVGSATTTSVVTVTNGNITMVRTNTTTYATTQTTYTTTQLTTQVPRSGLSGLEAVLGNSLYLFLYGLVLGWGPVLFVLSAVSLILLFKTRKGQEVQWLVIVLIILSLGTFYGSTVFIFNDVHFYVTQGLSNLIRLANSSLPAYVLLSAVLVDRITQARVKILAVLVIVITIGMAGFYVTAVQTNLQIPYNVISFGHVTMPLQARDYLIKNASYDNSTIVFLPAHFLTPQLYLRDIPGLVMYPTGNISTSAHISSAEVYRSNHTENLFVMLHPSQFYVLAGADLAAWPPNGTIRAAVNDYFGYAPLFLIKTYGFLLHLDTSSYGATPYTITSVSAVDSPTGHFLVVHVKWLSN